MAALHIVPVAGAKPTPKVLALIRERSFAMEAGRIATHGFKADGHDVLMQKAGGSIRALVRGGSSMPYMLNIKMEAENYSLNSYYMHRETSDVSLPGNEYHQLSGNQGAYFRFRFTSPIETDWQFQSGITTDKILSAAGISNYDPEKQGYLYFTDSYPHAANYFEDGGENACTGGAFIAKLSSYYQESASGEVSGNEQTNNLSTIFYTAIGNRARCKSTERYSYRWESSKVIPYTRLEETISSGWISRIISIRFGGLSDLLSLQKDQQIVRIEISAMMNRREIQQPVYGGGFIYFSDVPAGTTATITAELFDPPDENKTGFFPNTGSPLVIPDGQAPKLNSAKTRTVSFAMENNPETIVATHVFAYNFATGEMTLETV